MRRALAAGALGAGLLALWLASRMRTDPPPVPPSRGPFRLEARLELLETPEGFTFRVSGATDLPPETALRARVYAVEQVSDWRTGAREDEEPLVWDEDEGQPPFRTFRPQNGAFSVDVHSFRRRPYSVLYRARVTCRSPDPDVEDELSFAADLRLGSARSFAREVRDRHAGAQAEFLALEDLYRQIRGEILRQKASPDREAWQARATAWRSLLDASDASNRERFGLWCVWTERQMKMRLGGIADVLRRILDDQTAALAGDAERAARVEERTAMLAEYLDQTREEVGIDTLDADVFRPLLARYEGAVAGLPATRSEALEALFECAPRLQARRRAYALLNDVGFRLARLLERPDPPARAAHDRALAAFKSLAGLD